MKSRITVCLLNYKRPDNIGPIIRELKKQTLKPNIFLWDNAEQPNCHRAEVDWYVHSSKNMMCWPRWSMAVKANTDYVMSHDDDFMLFDNLFLEELVRQLDADHTHPIIGTEGVILQAGKGYAQSNGVPVPEGRNVDIVKGRLMAMRTDRLIRHVDLTKYPLQTEQDDIAISGLLSQGYPTMHRLHEGLRKRTVNLMDDHALWRQEGHWKRRDDAVRIFFPFHKF